VCGLYCGDNIWICAAAAEISAHAFADLFAVQGGLFGIAAYAEHTSFSAPPFLEQRHRRAYLSGSAKAALKAVGLEESLLHDMELSIFCKPFDGGDTISFMSNGQRQTAYDPSSVHQNSARSTLTAVATLFRSEHCEIFSQEIEEARTRVDANAMRLTVDGKRQDGKVGLFGLCVVGKDTETGAGCARKRCRAFDELPARYLCGLVIALRAAFTVVRHRAPVCSCMRFSTIEFWRTSQENGRKWLS